MPDLPPQNREQRRARGRPKGSLNKRPVMLRQSAVAGSKAQARQQASLNGLHDPVIPTSEAGPNFSDDNDAAIFSASDGFDGGSDLSARPGYKGRYGPLKTNIVATYGMFGMLLGGPNSPDGILFLSSAEPIADAWISWGKTDPRYMKLVQVLWGAPFMTLIMAHTPLAVGIMANHDLKVPGISALFNPARLAAVSQMRQNVGGMRAQPEASPLQGTGREVPPPAYRPAGPMAPTEDFGPPPSADALDTSLRVYPDEGVPHDVEIQIRQLAHQTGMNYDELRDAWILQNAQQRIAQQQRVTPPGALGVPVTQPGV